MLTWSPPSLNADGSAVGASITGFRINYGDSPSTMTLSVRVDGGTSTSATITGLPAGTYYFTVSTLNAAGEVSDPSTVVTKTVGP